MSEEFDHLQKHLGINVKLARVAAGLSQEELAHRADVERAHLSQIERGLANPSLKLLSRLAQALRTDVVTLLSDAERLVALITRQPN